METIEGIASVLMMVIRLGCIFRIGFCFIRMIQTEDAPVFKNRIKSLLMFYVITEAVWQIKNIILYYFG